MFLSSSWVGEAGTRVIWAAGFEELTHVLRWDAERRGASDRLVLLKAIGALDGETEFRALQKKLRKNLHCVEGRW